MGTILFADCGDSVSNRPIETGTVSHDVVVHEIGFDFVGETLRIEVEGEDELGDPAITWVTVEEYRRIPDDYRTEWQRVGHQEFEGEGTFQFSPYSTGDYRLKIRARRETSYEIYIDK